jgi:hypothetical protein
MPQKVALFPKKEPNARRRADPEGLVMRDAVFGKDCYAAYMRARVRVSFEESAS